MTVVGFVLVWGEAVEAGVAAGGVVSGEPLEDRPPCGGAVGVAAPVDELSLEAGERFGDGVVR